MDSTTLSDSHTTLFTLFAICAAAAGAATPNPNLPLDRPYTLQNHGLSTLEGEHHRMAAGEGFRSYILPRPCLSNADSSRVCGAGTGWVLGDTAGEQVLAIAPVGGLEARYRGGAEESVDFGIIAIGSAGPASFLVDARMFTEAGIGSAGSFDRESVDHQDESVSGSVAYTSYSRYRHNLSLDFGWGRLTAARDAAHWGPGQMHNLVFHQEAIPFNQLAFTARFGPLVLHSLYGQLVIEGDRIFGTDPESRSLYAHRYEWNVTNNLLLGVSEQVIAWKNEEPFSVLPIVPLFIAKGEAHERMNNGSIAADASWRLTGFGTVYSEFLIDDIQSPTSLFDNHWGNKWAWMAGAHWAMNLPLGPAGLVGEYVRIEPWVYTHYRPATAQSANAGYPLGNPLGPNAQAVSLKAYARSASSLSVSARLDLKWKGDDAGSSLQDEHREGETTKAFISGIGHPVTEFQPEVIWLRGGFLFSAGANIGRRMTAGLRAQVRM